MFIGHLVGAEIVHKISPTTPWWIVLTGAAFPDIFWGVMVLLGIEKVEMDPSSPLQKDVRFTRYPFSHSLILTNLIVCIPACIIGAFFGWEAGVAFVAASISHWLLDTIMHLRDLPILGFNGDKKIGLGLWKYSKTAFLFEYALVIAFTLWLVPQAQWQGTLIAATILHALIANSFFGFTKTNPTKTSKGYGALGVFGYIVFVLVFSWIL